MKRLTSHMRCTAGFRHDRDHAADIHLQTGPAHTRRHVTSLLEIEVASYAWVRRRRVRAAAPAAAAVAGMGVLARRPSADRPAGEIPPGPVGVHLDPRMGGDVASARGGGASSPRAVEIRKGVAPSAPREEHARARRSRT
ncbi:hypothetical protein FRAAL1952 [Frankia alni ACN14a]|uniref:Uncharacterized protein n=1 Tax=Frankia alni (strain DSM 45986 / CECT 9034 / ACN14a) TaxID=326424 RepID=Q0RPD1_FRAAA|nr:hypothetical protein FRAAL1952 [Frankia alni ACN14a]